MEIWNLVFMQFNRAADGTLTPLPKPSVDTGMGLERIAAVLQGVASNYDIDLFKKLIAAAGQATGTRDLGASALKVIADHIRAAAFLIVDGVLPGNEGRGYVLRRIIRRALRHGHELGVNTPFFAKLVPTLVAEMGTAYPELTAGQAHVEKVLRAEEERFSETLAQGMGMLKEALQRVAPGQSLAGELVFKLYDTFGFPLDLTADVARAAGLTIDRPGFERAMDAQRERARSAQKFHAGSAPATRLAERSTFTGYTQLTDAGRVLALLKDGQPVAALHSGDTGGVVLERTPFYGESGGQVGDQGTLRASGTRFAVTDTKNPAMLWCIWANSSPVGCRSVTFWRLKWTAGPAPPPEPITLPPTCSTPPSVKCWAPM